MERVKAWMGQPWVRRCGNLLFAAALLGVIVISRSFRETGNASGAADVGILASSPDFDRISGFGGAIPVRIVLDSGDGTIREIEFLPNAEDPEYWKRVLESGVFDKYRGLLPAEAAGLPVDAVSGATFSARAAQETIRATLLAAAGKPLSVSRENSFRRMDIPVILLLLWNLYCFFRPAAGKRRIFRLALNVGVLGIWAHSYLSFAQAAGWMRTAPLWTPSVPLLLFAAVLLLALARGKNFYCSGVCPYGCAQELAAKIGRKYEFPVLPVKFRWGPYIRRAVLGIAVLALICGVPFLPYEPFSVFQLQGGWLILVPAAVFLAVSFFIPRLWCRWFCGLGALLDFFCRTNINSTRGGEKMNFERVVILALLLLLAISLFRPAAPVAAVPAPVSPEMKSNDVLSVIHSRKSVRAYTKEPVTLPELETLVRAGFAAPTGGNAQPWAFLIVTDRARLDALAEVMPYGKMLKNAPAAIVVCGVSSEFRTGESSGMWVQDCSAATENILLAAEGTGLGAVWLGVYPYKERTAGVAKILGIPPEIVPFSIVSVGRPAGAEKPKDKFKPERIRFQSWDSLWQAAE
ncbi:MAG: 4Fe-4S binding protein [Lentisphaeria bacterium]|nr:4Fe-4S binding protein [Lentisphaeria bacterium]